MPVVDVPLLADYHYYRSLPAGKPPEVFNEFNARSAEKIAIITKPSRAAGDDAVDGSAQCTLDQKDWIIILPTDKLQGSQAFAVFNIGYFMFANLSKLHLHGVSPPWTASLFCRLRFLTVWDCPDGAPKVDMQEFIHAMNTWNTLQELDFRSVLAIFSRDDESESLPEHIYSAVLPKLERLTIQDLPKRVRGILSCLKLPSCKVVNIVGDLRGRDSMVDGRYYYWALRDVVPPPPHALAYLPFSLTRIDVEATDAQVAVSGYASDDRRVILRIETEKEHPERAQAVFFAGTTYYLSRTFSADNLAHVTNLRLRGRLYMVWMYTWVEIFRALPQLERLTVLDNGSDCETAINLIEALEVTVMFDKTRVVCPGLQFLSLRGVKYSEESLEVLCNVLQRRASYPETAGVSLNLLLVLTHEVNAVETCTSVRRKLQPVAVQVEVHSRYDDE